LGVWSAIGLLRFQTVVKTEGLLHQSPALTDGSLSEIIIDVATQVLRFDKCSRSLKGLPGFRSYNAICCQIFLLLKLLDSLIGVGAKYTVSPDV
jgi:hypothetical protein